MKVVKKILRWILNGISVAVILLAICMLLNVVMTRSGTAPSFFGYSVFRVMSGSMEPTLPTNALIVVRLTDASEVQEGDVISFYSRDPMLGGAINTHRAVKINEENGTRTFLTKGDANEIADKYEVQAQDLIGVVVFSSIFLGTIVRLVSNPIVFVPLIIVPLLLMLILNSIKTIRLSRSMLNEAYEAEQADKPNEIEEAAESNTSGHGNDPQTE